MKLARHILLAAALAGSAGGVLAQAAYEVDVDRDGRADYLMILEQSDTLA